MPVSDPNTKPRRLRADAARNRQALIDAAERLFAARGLAATLDDIAADAGVNIATAYRHFASKHELAEAFLQQTIDRTTAIAEQAAGTPDPWTGFTYFLEQILELMGDNRGLIDVFTQALGTEWFEQLQGRVRPLLTDLVARAQRAGSLRADVTAQDLGVILPMLGSITAPTSEAAATLRRRYLSLILAGLRPGGPALAGDPPTDADIRPSASTGRRTRK